MPYSFKLETRVYRCIHCILLLCWFHFAKAQPYYFRHYRAEDGLSNNTATCVVQDLKGFVWVGTKDGLNRFDGYNFKIFRHNPDDSTSIGNNSIWRLLIGKDGKIWIGTERGVYFFDPLTETFTHLSNTPKAWVRRIAQDKEGNVWFVIDTYLYCYNIANKKTTHLKNAKLQACSTLEITPNGEIWIGTRDGFIGRYDPVKDTCSMYSIFSHSPASLSQWIERIYDAQDGTLLIGTSSQGAKKFDINSHTYTDLFTYNENKIEIYVRDILKAYDTQYWFATENGIYIYNTVSKQYTHLLKNYNDPYSISDNAVYSFYKDKEKGIWVGTYFGGINYYPKSNPLFEKFIPASNKVSIHGNAIREMVADSKGYMWIGTEDAGLNKFDTEKGTFKNFMPNGSPQSLAYSNIHGLLLDSNHLWIGTFEHGLDIMDLATEKIIRHYNSGSRSTELHSNFVHSLYKTHDQHIWIGTSNGLYIYNRKNDNFSQPKVFPQNAFYSSILETSDGTIWAGTFQHGLYYYNPRKNIYGRLKIYKRNKDALHENRVDYLCESPDHKLWIATEDGLYKVDRQTKKVTIFSTDSGLPSNLVYAVTIDSLQRIWATTSKGLALLDKNGTTIRTFTKTNGLLGDQFNYSSLFQSTNNYIYAGSMKGMIRFNPLDLVQDDYAPPLYITNFSIFNTPLGIDTKNGPLYQSLLTTQTITLPYKQSTLNIDFAAINYESPDNVQYTYILEGLDKNWNYIKEKHSVYFTSLPYGQYIFKVRSTNSSGVWQNNERTLHITILPPIWKSKWAYFIYFVLSLACIIYAIVYYRRFLYNKHQRRMERYTIQKEKELVQSKIDFFTHVVHEIRTPLTLIKAPLEKIIHQIEHFPTIKKYVLTMQRNTERMIVLSDELLNFQRTEIGGFELSLQAMDITVLLKEIIAFFEETASSKNISMKYSIPKNSVIAHIDQEAFTKIISNLINNAIKYAHNMIFIEMRTLQNYDSNKNEVSILFKNDGKKISDEMSERIFEPFFRLDAAKTQSGIGIGLALSRSLSTLHNGTLIFDPTDENLNIFVLTLPLA